MTYPLTERFIVPFDPHYWAERIPADVIARMGGDLDHFFNEVINLWPWVGYGDWTTGRDMVENCVLMNYGAGEENFGQNIDRCMQAVVMLTDYLRCVLHPPNCHLPGVVDGRIVTGGLLEEMAYESAVFKMFYEEI